MNTSDSDNAFEKTAFQEGDSKHFSELARLQAGEHPIADPNVVEATSVLVEALSSGLDADKMRVAWGEYAQVVEGLVDAVEGTLARSKAQIAAILNKAYIFQQVNNTVRYLEELDMAEVYAANIGFDEASAVIDVEIKNQVEELELTPEVLVLKLRGIIDDNDREFLRDLINEGADVEDILDNANQMILEEGGDPEEILASTGWDSSSTDNGAST